MGFARVKCLLGDPEGKLFKEVEMLADTGAFYPIITPELAQRLGIEARYKVILTLADKRRVEAKVGPAYFKILNRDGIFLVAVMDVPEPLLGVTVLEGLGLRVDPTTGKVEYARPYGLAMLFSLRERQFLRALSFLR